METTDEELAPEALAERLVELRDEKKYVEGQIERISEQLAEALGEGVKARLGAVEIRVGKARPGLRVVTEAEVPEVFLTPKPDRKRIMEHIQATGEVPAGVQVSEGRPTVFAKLVSPE